jgi:hypothetical protein
MAEMVGDGDEVVFGIAGFCFDFWGNFFPPSISLCPVRAAIYRLWSPLAGRLPRALSIASAPTLSGCGDGGRPRRARVTARWGQTGDVTDRPGLSVGLVL